MAVTRPLSDNPAAERKRRSRKKLRELAKAAGAVPVTVTAPPTAPPVTPVTPVTPIEQAPAAPWHETKPVTGPGPEAFTTPLVFPANDNEPDAKPEPFATPTPPPAEIAPPPVTATDVAPVVELTMQFIKAGTAIAFLAYAPELAPLGIDGNQPMHPKIEEVVQKSVEAVCIKYNIRVPYQDELVVATAVGVAAFGFTRGRKRLIEMHTGGVTKPEPVDASTAPANDENAPIDVDAERPIRPPAPPRDDDGGAE